MDNNEWLTIKEVAEHLKLSVAAIRKYIRLGKLPYYRQGRVIRLKKSDVDNFLSLVRSMKKLDCN